MKTPRLTRLAFLIILVGGKFLALDVPQSFADDPPPTFPDHPPPGKRPPQPEPIGVCYGDTYHNYTTGEECALITCYNPYYRFDTCHPEDERTSPCAKEPCR